MSCVSNLALDRLLVDELALPERARIERHLAACSTCRERKGAFVVEARALAPLLAAEAARAAASHRSPRRSVWAVSVVAGLAAAMCLVMVERQASDTTRVKGSAALEAVVLRGDGSQISVLPGDTLHAGERVQFRVPGASTYTLVALDENGAVSRYPTAGSIELDSAIGAERVIAVLCDRPDIDVLAAARIALHAAGGNPRRVERLGVPCPEATTWFEQRPR